MRKAAMAAAFSAAFAAAPCLCSCGGDDGLGRAVQTAAVDEDDDAGDAAAGDAYMYRLPVVFHVFYTDPADSTQNIPAGRLSTILARVNEIYRGGVYGESENANLIFTMARYGEDGKELAEPGIHRVRWEGDYPMDPDEVMTDETGKYKKYLWDPNEYINVFAYQFAGGAAEGEVLGISHLPYSVKGGQELEGLETVAYARIGKANLTYAHCSSINSSHIYSESSRYGLADKGAGGYRYRSDDINVTLAHELGHYLGLHHIFTERDGLATDSCGDTDHCQDTPSYNRVAYSASIAGMAGATTMDELLVRMDCNGGEFWSANIMDYSVGLGYKLSADQKRRIRHVLNHSPLIPGPKVGTGATRGAAAAPGGPVRLPFKTSRHGKTTQCNTPYIMKAAERRR